MTKDELSNEVRAVMFVLSSEASLDGFDDRLLADAHSGLMAVIDKYLADQNGKPVRRIRHRAF
jgi:hypothetical protein